MGEQGKDDWVDQIVLKVLLCRDVNIPSIQWPIIVLDAYHMYQMGLVVNHHWLHFLVQANWRPHQQTH